MADAGERWITGYGVVDLPAQASTPTIMVAIFSSGEQRKTTRLFSSIDLVMTGCLPSIDVENFSSDEIRRVEI